MKYTGYTEKQTIEFSMPSLVNEEFAEKSMTVGVRKPDLYVPTVVTFGCSAWLSCWRVRDWICAVEKRSGSVFMKRWLYLYM